MTERDQSKSLMDNTTILLRVLERGVEMDNTMLIKPENICLVVNKYFERISAAQWSLLAAGTCDSDTEATLTDMFTEIVQTLSAQVLRHVLAIFQEYKFSSASDKNDVLISTQLGVSIADSFADALHVPQEKCESAEKLTELVELEISQKVSSLVSVATRESVLPEEPAIFVSGSTFGITALREMVAHATTCLKTYLSKLHFQCLAVCGWENTIAYSPRETIEYVQYAERCKSSQSVKSNHSKSQINILEMEETQRPESCDSIKSRISVTSMTEAVSDILTKWSTDTSDIKGESGKALVSPSTSLDAHDLAVEIVDDIIDDLHYPDPEDVAGCSETSTSPGPHFNVGIILDKVKDFCASHAAPKAHNTNKKFSKFVKKQFEKTVAELKSLFTTNDSNFLVSLKQRSESLRPKSACSQTSKRSLTRVKKASFASLNSETVINEVETLCDKLNITKNHSTDTSKIPKYLMSSGKIRNFAQELTDKMYDHMMDSRTYQRPSVRVGKSLSDSVISQRRRRELGTQHHFSPEVMYVMTEDAVVKFLQQVFLWMEKEPSYNTTHSDEVSGVLTDIQDLITTTLQEGNIGPQSPEPSHCQAPPPSRSSYQSANDGTLSPISNVDVCAGLNVRVHNDSRLLIRNELTEDSEVISPEVTDVVSPASCPTPPPHSSPVSSAEKSGEKRLSTSSHIQPPETEETTKPKSLLDDTILPPEDSRTIVNKYFDRLSAAQWSLLAAGTSDLETEATLADMFTEIVQTHSAGVLRNVLPMLRERMCMSDSQADVSEALENLNIRLGNSLVEIFADALNVPLEQCESAEKLTDIVEREISQKVTSLASVATKSSVLPEEPAVFVSSAMSSSRALRQMVSHAITCLKESLMFLCCTPKSEDFCSYSSEDSPIQILQSEESECECESCPSIKSKISVISATKAVSDILTKWSGDTPDIKIEANNDPIPFSTSPDVQVIAADIVNDIIDGLHSPDFKDVAGCSDSSTSPRTHSSLSRTVSKVKDFFTSQARHEKDTASTNQIFNKHSFFNFVKKQHDKMVGELKSMFTKDDAAYIVSLEPVSEKDGHAEAIVSGAILESSRSKSACSQTSETTMIHVSKKSSPVDFEIIKNDVETLCNELNLTGKPATHIQKRLHKIMSSDKIRKFSKELTDKMYDHLMDSKTYELPIFPKGKSLSDSVISQRRREEATTQFRLSPEVLYVMTEDAVRKFLQHVFLWMENESSQKTSERVSGAVTDIKDLITTLQEEINVGRPESPEASDSQTMARSHSSQLSANHADKENIKPESPEGGDRQMSSPVAESTVNNLIFALLYRLHLKASKKSPNSPWPEDDFDSVISRLTDKALDEINITDSTATKIVKKIKKINKAMIKDLAQEFGPPKQLLRVAIESSNSSFDDAVVKYLKIHLDALSSPPRKSAVARFFSAVGKAITKPFRCCIPDSCDD